MNHGTQDRSSQFANGMLDVLSQPLEKLPDVEIDAEKTRNAALCITAFLCAKLAQSGIAPQSVERTTFSWNDGFLNIRTAVKDHLWTNLRLTFVENYRQIKTNAAGVYLMIAWQPSDTHMHLWAIPEEVVYEALPNHPVGELTEKRTIRILPGVNKFERCTDSPDLTPYYRKLEWTRDERTKLNEAVKTDEVARQRNRDLDGTKQSTTDVFILKAQDADATGILTEKGFVVQKGALARKEIVPSAATTITPRRERLLTEGILEEHNGQLQFTQDYTFDSPSGASAAVLGRTSNGWIDWKHPDGRTLSELKRVKRASGEVLLSDAKRQQILSKYEQLSNEGHIYTATQRNQCYATFRQRFGPEALSALDGEALLEFMHDHGNKDSLVYWLEFQNDEEFATKRFGSISGGSALKFRVFRRKETGNWQAADKHNKPKDISLEEAIEYARVHRDQLLKGVEFLDQVPEVASDDDYANLQDQMDEFAPDVSDLAWGHKYFSLLYPEKLDDYHNAQLQRFHLLKLMLLPPEGKGRYICAGRFVSAAQELGLTMNQFSGTLNMLQGKSHRYWRVGTRSGGDKISHWPMMQENQCIAIGWKELLDLSWVDNKRETRQQLKQVLDDTYPGGHPSAIGNDCSQIIHFVAGLSEGDIILAADGATILGVGRVAGEYRYEPQFDFPHQRPVEWLNFDEWKMPIAEGLRSTVREIRIHYENIVEAEKKIQDAVNSEPDPKITRNIRLNGVPARIQSVLERKAQVILYGPPGTGKTYWAEKAANDLAALSGFGKPFDDLDEQQQQHVVIGDDKLPGTVRLCCFHPAYGYEDFLEGYRPRTVNGQVTFDLRDGVFKKLCNDAKDTPDRNFYLIVDEINRGDIPRIFGELLTTLEKDKRGKRIVLPVSQEVFTIPQNVFLIGTMNTADRSISLLDAALRRRFGFIEMMPDGTVLRDSIVSGIPLRAWFDALNERIRQHVGRDARNLQIGHSYLMQSGRPIKEIAPLKRAIRDDIIPLLEDYCYEDYGTLASILGTDLVDVALQRIRQELFDDGQEDLLVQGLLAPFAEISTSSEAISSDKSSVDEEAEQHDDEEEDDE
jgi:5-methylcytosine-specific restriction protein B